MKFSNYLSIALLSVAMVSCKSAEAAYEWKPVGDHIMTQWGENLDPANVHQEYPRPQMVREEWVNLNGLWDYAITAADAADFETADGKILVPFAVESALSGVGRAVTENDALWYERELTVPSKWDGKRILLHFGAIDWHAQVYVDGKFVGEHKGGYAPFHFDITEYLADGAKHTLKIKVLDTTETSWQPRGKQHLSPNSIWYTAVTGIWQTVWMEPVDNAHIDTYVAVADIDSQTLSVQVDADITDGDVCRIVLLDEGKVVSEAEGTDAVLQVPEMKLWSPDTPHLYDLEISVIRDGKVLDKVKGYTAMRKISHAKDASGHYRMLLNNEVLYQFGPLDQGWWPDGLYTAPCDEALMFDIVKAKEMGFNMIRKHVKVEPARWYWHCDRLGMLVWQDMPNTYDNAKTQWNYSGFDLVTVNAMTSEEGKANFYHEWGEILKANLNFPCIVMWVPFNEAWGQFDTKDVVDFTKSIDNTRLINYSSGGNFYTDCGGEIHDLHNYPDPVMYLYDPTRVNVLGEYGGIGWPVEGHLWQPDQNWGYIQYKSEEEVLATYEKYAVMLTYLVDWGFGAAIYTQLTDVEGEVNGLMTYDRKVVKLDINRLHEINKMVIKSL